MDKFVPSPEKEEDSKEQSQPRKPDNAELSKLDNIGDKLEALEEIKKRYVQDSTLWRAIEDTQQKLLDQVIHNSAEKQILESPIDRKTPFRPRPLSRIQAEKETPISDDEEIMEMANPTEHAAFRNVQNRPTMHDSRITSSPMNNTTIPRNLPHFRGAKGIDDPVEFLDVFSRICRASSVPIERYSVILPLCLENTDACWLESSLESLNMNYSWIDVRPSFISHFQNPNASALLLDKIRRLRMDQGGAQRYSDTFVQLADKLHWGLSDEMVIYQFKEGLTPWMLDRLSIAETHHLLSLETNTGEDTQPISVRILAKLATRIEANSMIHRSDPQRIPTSNRTPISQGRPSETAWKPKLQCNWCHNLGHTETQCRKKLNGVPKSAVKSSFTIPAAIPQFDKSKVKCVKCTQMGHYANECPTPRKPAVKRVTVNSAMSTSEYDTPRNFDPTDISIQRIRLKPQWVTTPDTIEPLHEKHDDGDMPDRSNLCIQTPCFLEGDRVMGFVDGGATHSFVSQSWVVKQDIPIIPAQGVIHQAFDKSSQPRIGRVEGLLLENGTRSIKVDLEVAELHGEEDLIIGMDLFQPLGFELVGVPFTWPQPKSSPKRLITMETPPTTIRPSGVDQHGIAEEWKTVLDDNLRLPPNSRCQLPDAELNIETNCDPIWIRQYPTPEGYRAAVDQQVQTWLDAGTIVPAPPNCKWNLPLLAVRKPSKDGSPDGVRVCLDGRPLNAQITRIPDNHLPGLREIQDSLGKFEWISTIDLADSYHQFPLRRDDRVKTAFTWNGCQYMFDVAPFGISVMAAHMQRLMEKLLGKFNRYPFQDDVPVATQSGGNHAHDVLEILECITYEAGLRLRLKKCRFFATEARVLGSLITRDGVMMDPLKIKSIIDWPRPIDGKAMQRFMGAANFHREFSPKFAEIAAPLEAVRNVTGVITWTDTMVKAFAEIKTLFGQNILLRSIDWAAPIYLTTDASLTGIGAWIGQRDQSGDIAPIVCASKKLNSTQQRWSATKQELWALMWAMTKFRNYLLGRRFIA